LALLPFGAKAARVTQIAWPAVFWLESDSEVALERLERAVAILPDYRLFVRLATGSHHAANREDLIPGRRDELLANAVRAYEAAYRINPFEPTPVVNLGNLASVRGEDELAERYFADALRLQGGMEAVFGANLMTARHFERKAKRLYDAGDLAGAIETMRQAVEAMECGVGQVPAWYYKRDERLAMHEALGVALRLSGDRAGAFEVFRHAAGTIGGGTVQYRLAEMLFEQAEERYQSRKPEEALYLFERALEAYHRSGGVEVPGVSPVRRGEVYRHITARIQFLKGARIEPRECEAFPR
jgi:tetratricopeptide (TPR) repeat protein